MSEAQKILCGRYNDLLKGHDFEQLCQFLLQHNMLSTHDIASVLSLQDGQQRKRELARILSGLGVKKFQQISSLLRQFKPSTDDFVIVSDKNFPIEPTSRAKPMDPSQMEPFTVLFYTFISQLKPLFSQGKWPSWLLDDVPLDLLSDYFPPEAIRVASKKSVTIKLSVLLDAYQQLISRDRPSFTQTHDSNLRELYEKSEERCKQLVVVTQQWALECGDKDKAIAIYEAENKQLKDSIDQMEKRVSKYKRFWQDNRNAEQFEDLRTELGHRRALYDKVNEEKQQAVEQVATLTMQNKQLQRETEALKDQVTELEDRLGNMRLQARAKEPTVREMSKLVSDLRESQERNERQLQEKKSMEDQILALQMTLEDYQGPQQPPVPAPRPRRSQAMVTGYHGPQYLDVQRDSHALNNDDTGSTTSEDTLSLSSYSNRSGVIQTMEVDPGPPAKEPSSDEVTVGLPDGDYTRATRYPSHSNIKITPLDEPLRCSGAGSTREKVCPSCKKAFMALTEREFQCHVASCFR